MKLAIEPADALQAGGNNLHGRDAARLDGGGQRVDRQLGEIRTHESLRARAEDVAPREGWRATWVGKCSLQICALAIGTFEGSIEQQVGAGQRAGTIDLLVGVVADPVAAGGEDHDGWRKLGHRVRIVSGLAQHLAVRYAKLDRRAFQQLDAFRGKERRAPAPALRYLNGDARLGLRGGDR